MSSLVHSSRVNSESCAKSSSAFRNRRVDATAERYSSAVPYISLESAHKFTMINCVAIWMRPASYCWDDKSEQAALLTLPRLANETCHIPLQLPALYFLDQKPVLASSYVAGSSYFVITGALIKFKHILLGESDGMAIGWILAIVLITLAVDHFNFKGNSDGKSLSSPPIAKSGCNICCSMDDCLACLSFISRSPEDPIHSFHLSISVKL